MTAALGGVDHCWSRVVRFLHYLATVNMDDFKPKTTSG
jgi:hypothetical protein